MAGSKASLSGMVLRIATALFLIAAGILTLQLDKGLFGQLQAGFGGNEIASAIYSLFKGDLANALIIVFGIIEVVAGAFLILGFFVDVGNINKIALLVILIMWIVVIVLVDFLGKGGLFDGAFKNMATFLAFLKVFSAHLLVLGGILSSMD